MLASRVSVLLLEAVRENCIDVLKAPDRIRLWQAAILVGQSSVRFEDWISPKLGWVQAPCQLFVKPCKNDIEIGICWMHRSRSRVNAAGLDGATVIATGKQS